MPAGPIPAPGVPGDATGGWVDASGCGGWAGGVIGPLIPPVAPIPDASPDWKLDPVEAKGDADGGDTAPPPGIWGIRAGPAEAGEVPAPNPPIDPICDGSPDPKLGMRAPLPPDPSPLPPPTGPKLAGMNGVCPGCGNKSV
ncbi:hypothetical protein PJM70_20635 [Mycobacterium kansasii]